METLSERLERLEAESRRMRRERTVIFALAAALCAAHCASTLYPGPQAAEAPLTASVRGSEFVLVDREGRTRARLGANAGDGSVGLALYDSARRMRASASVLADGSPSLRLLGDDEKARVTIEIDPDHAFVALLDGNEKRRAEIGVSAEGTPVLSLLDGRGATHAVLRAESSGVRLALSSTNQRSTIEMAAIDGGSELNVNDRDSGVSITADANGPNLAFTGQGAKARPGNP